MAKYVTKAELLAQAAELNLDVPDDATNAQIQELIDGVAPAVDEEAEAFAKAEAEAKAAEEAEQKALLEEQRRLEQEANVAPKSEGSEIALAIREGLASNKEDKRIKITADRSVQSRFAIVKDKQTGEIMLRENATGHLSKVQLQSIEEKEASLQNREVEPV